MGAFDTFFKFLDFISGWIEIPVEFVEDHPKLCIMGTLAVIIFISLLVWVLVQFFSLPMFALKHPIEYFVLRHDYYDYCIIKNISNCINTSLNSTIGISNLSNITA